MRQTQICCPQFLTWPFSIFDGSHPSEHGPECCCPTCVLDRNARAVGPSQKRSSYTVSHSVLATWSQRQAECLVGWKLPELCGGKFKKKKQLSVSLISIYMFGDFEIISFCILILYTRAKIYVEKLNS